MQSPSSSNVWWQCNSEGQIVGTKVTTSADLQNMLSAVNDHFGFSIDSYSTTLIGYLVGDIVPSWAAYEKIIIKDPIFVAINTGYYIFGEIQGSLFTYVWDNDELGYTCDQDGIITTYKLPSPNSYNYDGLRDYLIGKLEGFKVDNIAGTLGSYNIGDKIANWSSYSKI